MADRLARGHEVVGRSQIQLGDHRVERAGHVRAGVAIRNGVHVQPIQGCGVGAHGRGEADDERSYGPDVEPFESGHGVRWYRRAACAVRTGRPTLGSADRVSYLDG